MRRLFDGEKMDSSIRSGNFLFEDISPIFQTANLEASRSIQPHNVSRITLDYSIEYGMGVFPSVGI